MFVIQNIHRDYNRKNQVKAIISIIDKYILKKKLSYFIINNASLNDIYITKIIDLIQLDLDLRKWKFQYIKYIINLITKNFIFRNKSEIFNISIIIAKNINN